MNNHEYICPSYRIRRIKQSILNSQCDRCIDGKGYYSIDRDHPNHLLVCGFYERYVEEAENKRLDEEEEMRIKLMGKRRNERI